MGGKGQGAEEHRCGHQPWYLGQQGFLLLCHLPPDLGDLVDLRVEEAVLGPICFHVILEKGKGSQRWYHKHPALEKSPSKELPKLPSQRTTSPARCGSERRPRPGVQDGCHLWTILSLCFLICKMADMNPPFSGWESTELAGNIK